MAKRTNLYKFIFLIGIGFIFARAGGEFFQIAWGTGSWLGEFSLKWGAAFFLFILLSILSLTISGVVLWNERMRLEISARLVSLRERAGILRWIILAVIILTPAWFFQYTPWGVVFQGLYFRIVVW